SHLDDVAVAAVPSPRPDDDAFERSTFGTITLFSMLASRIDPIVAMDATDGWRGDAYAATPDETGRMCVTAEFAMATPDDADELTDALGDWAEQMPAEAEVEVELAEEGGGVTLAACDPGVDADLAIATPYSDALLVPVVRL